MGFTVALFIVFFNSVVVRLSYVFNALARRLYEYFYHSSQHNILTQVLFSLLFVSLQEERV